MEGCGWGDAGGADGAMQMGTDADVAGGRMQTGQMGDADRVDGAMEMETDADGVGAESPCPPLCRGAGEEGAAAWLSTLPPFGQQFQAGFVL